MICQFYHTWIRQRLANKPVPFAAVGHIPVCDHHQIVLPENTSLRTHHFQQQRGFLPQAFKVTRLRFAFAFPQFSDLTALLGFMGSA